MKKIVMMACIAILVGCGGLVVEPTPTQPTIPQVAGSIKSTYDQVIEGKSCKQEDIDIWSCEYKVGRDLLINMYLQFSGEGGYVFISKSDSEGDFFAGFATTHGCVAVLRGSKGIVVNKPEYDGPGGSYDAAYISLKNGKVYKASEPCP